MDPTAGWTSAGRPATTADFKSVLGSLKDIRIRAEYHAGASQCALDNVVFGALP
jgi:hypothetical protein